MKILSVNESRETDKIATHGKKSSWKQVGYCSLLGKWWNINLNNAHKTTIKPLRKAGLRSHRSQRGTAHRWSTWIRQRIRPLWSRDFAEQSVLWWIKIFMPILWDELSEKKQRPNNPNRYQNHRLCFIEVWNLWYGVPLRRRWRESRQGRWEIHNSSIPGDLKKQYESPETLYPRFDLVLFSSPSGCYCL